jgi:hypothetical protein
VLDSPERPAALCLRARVDAALGDTASLERDAVLLAVADPAGRTLGADVVPEVRDAFERARAAVAAIELRAEPDRDGERVRIAASLEAPSEVVLGTRASARSDGGPWVRGADEVTVVAPSSARVEYFVEALGPAGVVLAAQGSERNPLLLAVESTPASGDGDAVAIGVGLGVGAAALIAVGIVLGVLLAPTGEFEVAQPTYPILRMEMP